MGSDKTGGICGYFLGYGCAITDCYATDCDIEGSDKVGGIVGMAADESGADADDMTARVSHCGSNSTVRGKSNVGGVCGYTSLTTPIRFCYSTGAVSGESNVGGVCGYEDCYTDVSYCYATGAVRGDSNVGGVCGSMNGTENKPCKLTNCYFTGQVSEGGNGICGGALGHNIQVTHCYTTIAPEAFDELYSADRCVVGSVTLDRFKSGEIAWLLNNSTKCFPDIPEVPWRQAIGIDDTPRVVGPMLYQETSTETAGSAPTYYNYVDHNRDHKLTIGDLTQLIYLISNGSADSNMDVDGKTGVDGKPYVDQGDVEALVKLILK